MGVMQHSTDEKRKDVIQAMKDVSSLKNLITGSVMNEPSCDGNTREIPKYACEECFIPDLDQARTLLVSGTLHDTYQQSLLHFITTSSATFASLDKLFRTHIKSSRRGKKVSTSSQFLIDDLSIKSSIVGRTKIAESSSESSSTRATADMANTKISSVGIQWGQKYKYILDTTEYALVFDNVSRYHPAMVDGVSGSTSRPPPIESELATDESKTDDTKAKRHKKTGVLKEPSHEVVPEHSRKLLQCDCCGLWPAAYATYEDRLVPKSSALFCQVCYHMFHYSAGGALGYEHLVFEVPENHTE